MLPVLAQRGLQALAVLVQQVPRAQELQAQLVPQELVPQVQQVQLALKGQRV